MAEEDKDVAKKILREWCRLQEQKYGPGWKKKLANEMAAQTTPMIQAFLKLQRKS